ncbi:hypothetical protein [Ruminiclostridium cellobioparum]|uniref:hypothetical protein n=1 Tax=Ruminiclostridium cellobioparum TaxID=29355 RepID=UPI0028AE5018|nr:hypothetical protein [Ruminiclostridium cellobioparum]
MAYVVSRMVMSTPDSFWIIWISSENLLWHSEFRGLCIENNVPMPAKSAVEFNVDSKLMKKMREKKAGQGYKDEDLKKSLLI